MMSIYKRDPKYPCHDKQQCIPTKYILDNRVLLLM